MIKLVKKLEDLRQEILMALKELREALTALEALLASPDVKTFENFRKEALDVIQSIKTKGV